MERHAQGVGFPVSGRQEIGKPKSTASCQPGSGAKVEGHTPVWDRRHSQMDGGAKGLRSSVHPFIHSTNSEHLLSARHSARHWG